MSKYYEQTHAHKGNGEDGSTQIDYSALLNPPLSGSDIAAIVDDPTGFTGTPTVTHNSGDTVTIGGSYECYYRGERVGILEGGYTSPSIPTATTTTYFLTYNGTNTAWRNLSTYDNFFVDLLIAYAYYDSAESAWIVLQETHGVMPWESHREFHETVGTYLLSGGILGDYTLDSTTAADRRPSISAAEVKDEDNIVDNAAWPVNTYTTAYNNSTPVFVTDTGDTDIIALSTNQPYYNSYSGTWGQTLFPANSVGTVWVFAVPTALGESADHRFLFVQPQWVTQATGSSATRIAAAAAIESTRQASELNLTTFAELSPEYILIARVMVVYVSNNWKLYQVDAVTGTRQSQVNTPSGAQQTAAQVPYDNTTSGLDAEDVQDAIDELSSAVMDFTRIEVLPTSNQSISSSLWTKIVNWGTPTIDSNSEFSSNKFTADSDGRYLFDGQSSVTFGAVSGRQQLSPYVNGSSSFIHITQSPIISSQVNFMNYTFVIDLSAGDYVELYYYQDSGGSVNTSYAFFMQSITRLL